LFLKKSNKWCIYSIWPWWESSAFPTTYRRVALEGPCVRQTAPGSGVGKGPVLEVILLSIGADQL